MTQGKVYRCDATNELDEQVLSDRLFLKKPERIMSLIMIMTLSLLIYSLAEKRIRNALQKNDAHIWDQKNKPTDRPTARWVFTIFEDVLLLYTHSDTNTTVQAMNMRKEHQIVLKSLGEYYQKMYFL